METFFIITLLIQGKIKTEFCLALHEFSRTWSHVLALNSDWFLKLLLRLLWLAERMDFSFTALIRELMSVAFTISGLERFHGGPRPYWCSPTIGNFCLRKDIKGAENSLFGNTNMASPSAMCHVKTLCKSICSFALLQH